MGGRSAAAKGSTLEPRGRPPRPSSRSFCCRRTTRTPERARAPEPRAHRTKPANPSALQPGANPQQRARGRELTPRGGAPPATPRSLGSRLGAPRAGSGRKGSRAAGAAQAGYSSACFSPGYAHTTFSLVTADTGSLKATPPAAAYGTQEEPAAEVTRLGFAGSLCWEPSCALLAAPHGLRSAKEKPGSHRAK